MTKLLITLRFYAVGTFYQTIGDFFGVSQFVVLKSIHEVSFLIASKLRRRFVTWPQTEQELLNAKVDFMRKSRFPLCISAIDGTHVLIQSYGGDNAEVYRNRKLSFSHDCQVLVSADVSILCYLTKAIFKIKVILKFWSKKDRILDIISRWPGSAHDSTIFTHSNMYVRFRCSDFSNDSLLVADSAYPPERFVCKPLDDVNTVTPSGIFEYRKFFGKTKFSRP